MPTEVCSGSVHISVLHLLLNILVAGNSADEKLHAAGGSWRALLRGQCTMQQMWRSRILSLSTLCGLCAPHAKARACGRPRADGGLRCADQQHQLAQAVS